MLSPFKKINFKFQSKIGISHLYSLLPIGVGTPMVESFSSYIIRLAEAHCVTVGVLVAHEISPLLKKKYLTPERSRKVQSGSMLGVIKSIESTAQTAVDWVHVLEKLTLRTNLLLLTMLPFKEIFSARNLLRDKRAWCPLCFEALKNKKEIIYEPLLWRLRAAKFCPTHNTVLEDFCCACKRDKQPILASSMRTGFCYYCKNWLGRSGSIKAWFEEKAQFQIQISKSISKVLAESKYLNSSLMKRNIIANIHACINYYSDGKTSKLAQLTNVSPRIINHWRNETNLFRLDLLAKICLKLNLPLRQFVMGNIRKPNILIERNFKPLAKKTRKKKTINLIAMRKLLESAIHKKSNVLSLRQLAKNFGHDTGCFKRHFPELCTQLKKRYRKYKETERKELLAKIKSALNEYPPPSVATLSRRLNRCIPTLYNSFPKLCHDITKKHKAHKENLRKDQLSSMSEEIRQIAFELHNDGIYPSQKKVGQLMNKPGRMGNKPAREILRKIQQILSPLDC
jgi:hypothetical protein